MNPEVFQKKFQDLLEEVSNDKEGLPLFAIAGIVHCTMDGMLFNANLAARQAAAMKFAQDLANQTPGPESSDSIKEN